MAVQAADPQALFLQDLGRQDAVQAAGKKHDHIPRPLVSIDPVSYTHLLRQRRHLRAQLRVRVHAPHQLDAQQPYGAP